MKSDEIKGGRIGVDIGGTFTDLFLIDTNGTVFTKKVLSTPDDYSEAVAIGIEELLINSGLRGEDIKDVVHGTTIVTNTCIELTGAKVGLITTKGFRDVLEMGRGRMPKLYDLTWSKPRPIVPRYLRYEVDERVDKNGKITQPLDSSEVEVIIDKLLSQKVESVAVCLYNSPRNPVHEQKIGELIRQRAPHLYVSLSTKVMSVMKEYERTCEVTINAYVMPLVAEYMIVLKKRLVDLGVTAPLFVMQSSGGMITIESSAEKPIEIVECGPAGGVVGAAYLAKMLGFNNLITFDLGGTTCKASIVENRQFTRSAEYEVGAGIHMASRLRKGKGYVLRVSSIDIAEIGAGGGSILWLDSGGLLNVGPKSAGAAPGPACYDKGGKNPTLTDCYLTLGYLNPDYLLGGEFKLNPKNAFTAIDDNIVKPLGMEITEAAYGAYRIANSNMARAIRAVSSERGRDPRKFTLLVFGGAGSLHGAAVAKELGIKRVIVAPYGGVFSAFGFLCADIERYYVQAFSHIWDDSALIELNRTFDAMTEKALASSQKWGYKKTSVQIERYVDLRYIQQGSELSIPVPQQKLDHAQMPSLAEAFSREHKKTFGHNFSGMPLEVVNLRLVAKINVSKPTLPKAIETKAQFKSQVMKMRKAYFGTDYGFIDTPVLQDSELDERPLVGPLLIDRYDTTIVVPPHCEISSANWGSLIINVKD